MIEAKWIKDVRPEDMPHQYDDMVTLIGIEATMKLADYYKKQPFYFVGLERLIEKKKKEYIVSNFTGDNHGKLARETGYSSRWVYEIIENHYAAKRNQPGLFDKEQLDGDS